MNKPLINRDVDEQAECTIVACHICGRNVGAQTESQALEYAKQLGWQIISAELLCSECAPVFASALVIPVGTSQACMEASNGC